MPGLRQAGRIAVMAVALAGGGVLAGPGTALAAGCQPRAINQPANPAGTGGSNFLSGVSVLSACDAWMVGQYESASGAQQTLTEHWTGGPDWTVVPSPSPGQAGGQFAENDLRAVAAVSADNAWAVGSYSDHSTTHGLVLRWDGSHWTQADVPGGGYSFGGVTALSARDVWVAGIDTAGLPLLLHFDGTDWAPSDLTGLKNAIPAGARITLDGMTATSASDVWAVGSYTVGFSIFENTLTLHWDGLRWSRIPSPVTTPPGDELGTRLVSVSATSASDVWAVGDAHEGQHTAILHYDGQRWAVVPSPDPGAVANGPSINGLNSVAAVSPDSAFAVGAYGNDQDATESQSLLLQWDGRTWTQIPSPSPGLLLNGLDAVASGPAGTVWAAGSFSDHQNTEFQATAAEFGVVPGVIGDPRAAAVDALNGAGLDITITEVRPPGSGCGIGNAGTVIAASPAAGTLTAFPVNLTVCATTTAVPGVLSFDDASARRAITSAGLTAGSVTMTPSCAALRGEVLTQNPAQDTVVPVGSAVSLTEATGRQPNGKPCPIE